MRLLIVESPAKAKTIEKYLGDDFTVRASIGHVRDLPKKNKDAIDIDGGFIPHYEITAGKEKVINDLRALSKKASEVYLATDPDREGEAIAWHIKEAINLKKPKRIVFHEITEVAVKEAMKHPRKIDEKLKEAQEARRVLDRLVGYDLSGLIWKKVRYGLSAGRVQSPALRILVEREREIKNFTSEKFWVISALVSNQKGNEFTVICEKEPREKSVVEKIIEASNRGSWSVVKVSTTEAKRSPRAPFTTSTLQQAASSRLGFSPSKTMANAQKLYEGGLITYMRTDSTTISSSVQKQIIDFVKKEFGDLYVSAHVYKTKTKNAQEAHEAIRPTNISLSYAGRTDEQRRLYKLIHERAVSSQMADAKILRTKITTNCGEEGVPNFSANGSIIIFDGWLKGDPKARGEDVELPKVEEGEKLNLKNVDSEEKETQPPPRYTEAGLVKELEKRGIGRPSTYASIIKTISDRGYVEKVNRVLIPTDIGDVVSTFLETNFSKYISDDFTASMENELDEIASGERSYKKTLKEFYDPFKKEVKSKEKIEKLTNLGPADEKFKCPKCGGEMIIKLSKNGRFMSCKRFPECDGSLTIEGKELQGPKSTGRKCPDCPSGILVEREGRFGNFIACSNYPKCKHVENDEEAEKKKKTGIVCPVCKKGEMMERRGRFGIFYSCSNYPECKHAIKAKPTGKICEICGSLMMEGTKTIPERCSNKNCENHNPHKLKK